MSGSFASDNYAGALPEVIDAIAAANSGHAPAYGNDDWTARVQDRFRMCAQLALHLPMVVKLV